MQSLQGASNRTTIPCAYEMAMKCPNQKSTTLYSDRVAVGLPTGSDLDDAIIPLSVVEPTTDISSNSCIF